MGIEDTIPNGCTRGSSRDLTVALAKELAEESKTGWSSRRTAGQNS